MLAAVKKEWPGNAAPIFRGNRENMLLLEKLADSLERDCQFKPTSVNGVIFGPKAIKQHCLDAINEKRRRLNSGHDYAKVKSLYLCIIQVMKTLKM